MAEYSPSVLWSIRVSIKQPKAKPLAVSQQEDFHFDSRAARQDFMGMLAKADFDTTITRQWEQIPPQRSLVDDAFNRAKQISEDDPWEKSQR